MTTTPHHAHQGAFHRYRALRDFVRSADDALPGKFEITKGGIVHDLLSPNGRHELTASLLRKRLEKAMPEEVVAHTGAPDVEDEYEGIMRRPDVMVIAMTDMDVPAGCDPRTLIAAIDRQLQEETLRQAAELASRDRLERTCRSRAYELLLRYIKVSDPPVGGDECSAFGQAEDIAAEARSRLVADCRERRTECTGGGFAGRSGFLEILGDGLSTS